MSHKPNKADVVADLRRSLSASFSKLAFDDPNFKIFFEMARKNLDKIDLDRKTRQLVIGRFQKVQNSKESVDKRREDILIISSLV